MTEGYILHTDPEWLKFHRSHHEGQLVGYTRGPNGALKSLVPEGLLVFLEGGTRPHAVGGIGTFAGNDVTTLNAAWMQHDRRLGASSRDEYLTRVQRYVNAGPDDPVAVLLIEGFRGVHPPIPLAQMGVSSKLGATRGWGLTEEECRIVVSKLGFPGVPQNITDAHLEEAFGASTVEGRRLQRLHLRIERDRGVVKRAKAEWARLDPLLRCEACGFSFGEHYGELGTGFVEAHHRTPLGQLKPGQLTKTTTKDLAPVCANCHRMLHRAGGLSIRELAERVRR